MDLLIRKDAPNTGCPAMKITHAAIDYNANYRQQTTRQRQQTTQASVQADTGQAPARTRRQLDAAAVNTRVRLDSSQQQQIYTRASINHANGQTTQQMKSHAMSSMLSRLYSQDVRMVSMLDSRMPERSGASTGSLVSRATINEHTLYQTEQQLGFAARGSLTTDDGRTIQFEFYANATQQYRYESGSGALAERVVQRHDPLVINFAGGFNNLSDTLFQFDLNGDGDDEQLAFTGQGSGFLVFDRNQDGIINNGSEMFGASSGDGFAELAAYDDDGNGFIDSGDALFNQLQIYTLDGQGKPSLMSLADANIGAIGVSSGQSPFAITDHYNNELGMARRTGIFVSQDGQVGSVQQIDLTERDLDKEARDQARFSAPSDPLPTPDDADEAAPALSERFAQILDAVEKLQKATEDLLNRDDAETTDDQPASLLSQLVEALEAQRIKRTEQQEATSNPLQDQDTKRA